MTAELRFCCFFILRDTRPKISSNLILNFDKSRLSLYVTKFTQPESYDNHSITIPHRGGQLWLILGRIGALFRDATLTFDAGQGS